MALNRSSGKHNIWIDTDIIFNKPGQEIDDGLALMMAFNNLDVEVAGISLIHAVSNGYEVTKKLQNFYGDKSIPVYKGTDDATESYGTKTEAVDALAKALQNKELTVVAIGPATNIANLLEFYPEAAQNIKDIVFCAGRNKGVSFIPENANRGLPDYNFDLDPESFKRVLESDLHITFSGYEASSSIYLYKDDIEQLKENGNKGDAWVYEMLQPWLKRWKKGLGVEGFIPFDCCTIGHVFYSDYFSYNRDIPVQINVRENDCGAVIDADEKPYMEVSHEFESPWKVDFVYETDPAFKQVIMNDLLGKKN